jgi:hypothetical protein
MIDYDEEGKPSKPYAMMESYEATPDIPEVSIECNNCSTEPTSEML